MNTRIEEIKNIILEGIDNVKEGYISMTESTTDGNPYGIRGKKKSVENLLNEIEVDTIGKTSLYIMYGGCAIICVRITEDMNYDNFVGNVNGLIFALLKAKGIAR